MPFINLNGKFINLAVVGAVEFIDEVELTLTFPCWALFGALGEGDGIGWEVVDEGGGAVLITFNEDFPEWIKLRKTFNP